MVFFQCKGSHVFLKLLLGLKSTGWCVLGCWQTIYSVQTSFFLAVAEWWRLNELHVLRMCTAASRSHSAEIDGNRVDRFEWGIAWSFACKMHDIEMSSEFKSGEYCSQSVKYWNSTNSRFAFLAVQAGAESTKRHIFHQDKSLWTQRTTCCLRSS